MKTKKIKGLTIQFIPYNEIEGLSASHRVKKILDIVLNNRIVIIQGRLESEEEARLIEDTMALMGHVKGFKGVELAVIEPKTRDLDWQTQIRYGLAKALVGNTGAVTIIGPASVIKEIKRDPKKIELMLK